MKPKLPGWRELMQIPGAEPDADDQSGRRHPPGATNRGGPSDHDADDRTPHPTAPGRDSKGRLMPAPAQGEICPTCKGSGRMSK